MVNFEENKENLNISNNDRVNSKTKRRRHIPHALRTPEYVRHRNNRERRRVDAINKAFCDLEKHVPFLSIEERNSKVDILNAAAYYIRKLSETLIQSTLAQCDNYVYRRHSNGSSLSSRQSQANVNFQNEENNFALSSNTCVDNEFNFNYNCLSRLQPAQPRDETKSVAEQRYHQDLNMNLVYGLPQCVDNGDCRPLQTTETIHCSTNTDSGLRCITYADSGSRRITYNAGDGGDGNPRDGNRTPLRDHWLQNGSNVIGNTTNNMMKAKHSPYMEISEPTMTTNFVDSLDNQQFARAGILSHDIALSGYSGLCCLS